LKSPFKAVGHGGGDDDGRGSRRDKIDDALVRTFNALKNSQHDPARRTMSRFRRGKYLFLPELRSID
jgi:hypothetical protein